MARGPHLYRLLAELHTKVDALTQAVQIDAATLAATEALLQAALEQQRVRIGPVDQLTASVEQIRAQLQQLSDQLAATDEAPTP